MSRLDEVLQAILQREGGIARIEGSLLQDNLVIRNKDGWVTHRIEKGVFGDFIVRNMSTGMVERP